MIEKWRILLDREKWTIHHVAYLKRYVVNHAESHIQSHKQQQKKENDEEDEEEEETKIHLMMIANFSLAL